MRPPPDPTAGRSQEEKKSMILSRTPRRKKKGRKDEKWMIWAITDVKRMELSREIGAQSDCMTRLIAEQFHCRLKV